MTKTTRVCVIFLAAVLSSTVALLPASPALAVAPCSGSSCDGLDPSNPTIISGCGAFLAYAGASRGNQSITILYSKTCHAAYAELDFATAPTSGTSQGLSMFYQSQYGGRAHVENGPGGGVVSPTVILSALLGWDYSIKACYYFGTAGSITDPEPFGASEGTAFCTPWV